MTCQHHYILEAAAGPTSRGVCKFCGATRDFPSSLIGQGQAVKTGGLPPGDFVAEVAWKRAKSARAKETQARLRRFDKVCLICGLPYLAYRDNQMTCQMVECRRAWNRIGEARRRGATK